MSRDWTQLEPVTYGRHVTSLYRVRTASNILCAVRYFSLPVQQGQLEPGGSRSSDTRLNRMHENINSLIRLSHPNLVGILDVRILPEDVELAMFMELVDGTLLEDKILANSGLPEEEIQFYLKQICSALSYLHENSVIHRNLDTATVIVAKEGKIKLLDFGLSVQLMEGASTHPTYCPRGRPYYLAPELLQGDDTDCIEYSRGSDIWALGCIAYEMAAGRKPYAEFEKKPSVMVKNILTDGAPDLPERCSRELKDFYSACTHKDERRNRQSAANLLQHAFITRI